MRARSASGSVDSPSAVEPTRSQKRTVTTLRCSRAGSIASRAAAPQALQKRASPGSRARSSGMQARRGVYEGRAARSSSSTARERCGRDDVALLLVESDRLLDRSGRRRRLRPERVRAPPRARRRRRLQRRGSRSARRARPPRGKAHRLVVRAASRQDPRESRSPARLCVEIVGRRDRAAFLGELARPRRTALPEQDVGEHGVDRASDARVADRRRAGRGPRRSSRSAALEVTADQPGRTRRPPRRCPSAGRRPNSSIRRHAVRAARCACARVALHREEQRANLERVRPVSDVRRSRRPEACSQRCDAVPAGVGPQATGEASRSHVARCRRRLSSAAGDRGRPLEVGLALAGAAELEAAHADLGVRGEPAPARSPTRSSDAAISRASASSIFDGRLGIDPRPKRVEREARAGVDALVSDRARDRRSPGGASCRLARTRRGERAPARARAAPRAAWVVGGERRRSRAAGVPPRRRSCAGRARPARRRGAAPPRARRAPLGLADSAELLTQYGTPARGGSRRSRPARTRLGSRAARATPRTARGARARSSFGIAAYAASRIRRCRKRNASSPGMSAGARADQLLADEAASCCVELGAQPFGRELARPRRDGTPRPRPPPRSMHDPLVAVERVECAPAAAPGSSAARDVASPPVARGPSRASPRRRAGSRPTRRRSAARIASSSACPPSRFVDELADSSSPSGSSRTDVAFSLPPPHPGRASSSSVRATQRRKIGASRDKSATCSTRSTNVGSAHCRSSTTTTCGRSAARASSSRRNATLVSGGRRRRGRCPARRRAGERSRRAAST